MKAGPVAPRTVAGELATVGPHASVAPSSTSAEEVRLGAVARPLASASRTRAIAGAPSATSAGIAELATTVSRIGPALADPATLSGLDAALAPRIEAVRRMTTLLAELLVLDETVSATRRATRLA